MRKLFAGLILILGACLPAAGALAADAAAKGDITIVYWGSKDCRWCTYWESASSGQEAKFRALPEFAKVNFYKVKNERLADGYTAEHFPPELGWLWERYQKTGKHPGRPGWQVYVGRKIVGTFQGSQNWEGKHLPQIVELIAQNSAQ